MGHFNDQYLDDCDRRTSDDDFLDRRDGVSSAPQLFTTQYRKEIKYDRATRDYAMYLDGELVGFARNNHEAEVTLDQLVYELLIGGATCTATELDGGSAPDQMAAEQPARYTRDARFDKRFAHGDPYAGDAWRDATGMLRWVAVGADPNVNNPIRV